MLLDIVENKETVTGIKKNCISRAADYLPANVIQILIKRMLWFNKGEYYVKFKNKDYIYTIHDICDMAVRKQAQQGGKVS